RALEARKPPRLSAAAMEVLTLVAYFQPVTKTYIEQIRGVDSSYTVSLLVDRELIEPCGRLDVPGRPTIYRTTNGFLRAFGLSSLDDLPEQEELPQNILMTGTAPGEVQMTMPEV
ncbi:MAG: SMC-Scp complex subunit ScpB, partial [Oscillospiraceae bacterium]|nr:SMC-Scp complex subunit ScpB [Oscillospiraceae bacterium]